MILGMLVGTFIFMVGFLIGRTTRAKRTKATIEGGKCECSHNRSVHKNAQGTCMAAVAITINGEQVHRNCACEIYIRQPATIDDLLKYGSKVTG